MRRILIGIYFLFTSCHLPVYTSESVHTPFLSQKNEFHGEASVSSRSIDIHPSFAVSNHIGLMAGFATNGEEKYTGITAPGNFDGKYTGHHHFIFFECGPGYFERFNKNGLWECYVNYGQGKVRNKYADSIITIPETADYYRLSIQPGVGFKKEKIQLIFTLRYAYVNLYNYRIANTLQHKIDFFVIDPAVTFKFGSHNLKGFVQAGFTKKTRNYYNYDIDNNSQELFPFIFTFGMHASINFRSKKNSSEEETGGIY